MHSFFTLSDLPVGGSAVIHSMSTGRAGLTRLRELGLTPGTRVQVIRRAPLGEPIQITVRGSHLAMRGLEASQIRLTQVEQPIVHLGSVVHSPAV